MRTHTRLAGLVAAATLSLGTAGVASAAPTSHGTDTAPCARQQAQVDKAEDALARVTAVFARQQDRVADAKDDVATADSASERGKAQRALAHAKQDRQEAAKAKKAQVQRLAKAQERLDACTAAQEQTA